MTHENCENESKKTRSRLFSCLMGEENKDEVPIPPTLPIYSMTIEQVLALVQGNINGLNDEDIEERESRYGRNILPETKCPTLLDHLFDQMNSPLIYVLLASSALTLGLGHVIEGLAIFGVVIIDVSLGLWLEDKSERSIKSLKGLLSKTCTVRRNGVTEFIDSRDLTVGDIFFIHTGDIVPADGRIITSSGLVVVESLLTGEVHAIPKAPDRCVDVCTPLSERSCLVYSGTKVTKGDAVCVVTNIGLRCEIGKIHLSLERVEDPKTPLVHELENLERKLVVLILVVALFAMGIASIRGYSVTESFDFAIAIAVAAIPEELPSCVTIAFTVGIKRMEAHKAVVKLLSAAETLGSVSVICSEKFGTLTKNEIVVHFICTEDRCYEVSRCERGRPVPMEATQIPVDLLLNLISPALYCNDSSLSVEDIEESSSVFSGHPIDDSLFRYAMSEFGPEKILSIRSNLPIEEISYDVTKKFMATLHDLSVAEVLDIVGVFDISNDLIQGGRVRLIFLKGDPEKVVDFCMLEESSRVAWLSQAVRLGERGFRVLACAYRIPEASLVVEVAHRLSDLNMTCLLGFDNPPREEAILAIESARIAGIKVKMITGDHPTTALTIGERLGLIDGQRNSITGADLDSLIVTNDLSNLDQVVQNNNIFARALPSHKLMILQSLQRQHFSCCMTGDGVNDAPALKQANIGVAMGLTGADVAKEASNIIITDNNFSTIVEAIKYGRCTYSNLLKILIFTLPINAAQAWSILIALILDVEVPFIGMQILWINMVPAVLLAIVLAFEKPDPQTMNHPPRPFGKSIFGKFLIWRIFFVAMVLVVAVLGNMHWEKVRIHDLEKLRTVAVNTLVVGQSFYLFNCRYPRYNVVPWQLLLGNSVLPLCIGGVVVAQSLMTYLKPFQYIFQTNSLDNTAWFQIFLCGFSLFLIIELEKAIMAIWNCYHPRHHHSYHASH